MIGDVQSILNGNGVPEKDDSPMRSGSLTSVGRKIVPRKSEAVVFKKPEGMSRELFNLLSAAESKEITSMMPTEIKKGYRNAKAQVGLRAARKYKWVPFVNEARSDGLQLYHWQRVDRLENLQEYIFAKFNKIINIPTYTTEEYDKHLKCAKWTREETDYFFDMCRRFDLRWPIIHDRYDKIKFNVVRTIEDMKERFYSIISELGILKDPTAPPVFYDAENERRRKEQLNKQWNRSKEELEEEEELVKQLRTIEARKKEREKKAQDLQKLINMVDTPCSPSLSGGMSPALGKKKNNFRQKLGSTASSNAYNYNPNDISGSAIRFPEFKSAGAHFRSQELKLPTNVGAKKLKNIEVALEKCKMDANPMGSEPIVSSYNDFRSQVMLLQELKSTLQNAEFELESLRNKLKDSDKVFEIEPRMRVSNLLEGGLDESALLAESGAPRSTRRIASYLDVSTAANPVLARKRKAPVPGGPSASSMDLKRSRKYQ